MPFQLPKPLTEFKPSAEIYKPDNMARVATKVVRNFAEKENWQLSDESLGELNKLLRQWIQTHVSPPEGYAKWG